MGSDTVRRSRRLLEAGVLVLALVLAMTWPGHRDGQAAANTAVFALVAGQAGANGGFNFNGYSNGALTITVPVGWTVVIHYRNGSNLRHSFDVTPWTGKQPDKAPPPIFAGASTKDLVDGIGVGGEETITFVARRAGKYEFLCGVLGHAQAGMWDVFVVSPTATEPAVRPAGAVVMTTR